MLTFTAPPEEIPMTWRPIVGRAFATPQAFADYVDQLAFGLWRPRFVVVHNTSAPSLAQYAGHWSRPAPITDEQWMANLIGYYRDQEHWSGGPHLFVTPRSICAFTPLTGPGTHSPSWNAVSWGVETVGEFETEPFDGPVRANLVAALGILHAKAALQPRPYALGVRGLHFHKEDVATTHKACPGRHMDKADLVAAVEAWIVQQHGGEHVPAAAAPSIVPAGSPAPSQATPARVAVPASPTETPPSIPDRQDGGR